jgi:trimeric autotransporter adhesin
MFGSAQIILQQSPNGSITISPSGFLGKFKNSINISNVALGTGALDSLNNVALFNTAVGGGALNKLTAGGYNVALGSSTISKLRFSGFNTALGAFSMINLTDESNSLSENNVGVGYGTFGWTLKSNGNTAIGTNSQNGAVGFPGVSNDNTSVGNRSMANNQTGSFNTSTGAYSLESISTGDSNTVVGAFSGFSNTTGDRNVFLGMEAGYSNSIGDRNVFIGYRAGYNNVNGNDNLVIENSDAANPLIIGNFASNKLGIKRTFNEINNRTETFQVTGEAFKTAGTGNWNIPSDRRLKENIKYLDSHQMLGKVLNMKGVSYNWIDKSKGTDKVFGFIAQDLQTVFPENVKTDKEGYLSASYGAYDPMIIESIKALKELIDQQREEINALKAKLQLEENHTTSNSEKK